ncbi:hypothetical protein [Ferrimonas sp. YFM]
MMNMPPLEQYIRLLEQANGIRDATSENQN